MNNYYTLIYQTEHLKNKFEGSRFLFSISPHKNVWEGYFELDSGDKTRLIFSSTTGEIALFSSGWRAPKKSNVLTFFDTLQESRVSRIDLADGDRWITMQFETGTQLRFRLFSARANILLTREHTIHDAFKNPGQVTGTESPAPRPASPNRELPPDDLSPKKKILHFDQTFPRPLIPAVIRHYTLEDRTAEETEQAVRKLQNAMLEDPCFRILRDGNLCLVSEDILPEETLESFDSINEAVTYLYYNRSHQRRFSAKRNSLASAVEDELRKDQKRLEQLEDGEKALERADQYEQTGHLLMARAHESIPPDVKSIPVTNFYENNRTESVSIKPELSMAENAQLYYERSSKARKRVEANKLREKEIRKEIPRLEKLLDELNSLTRYKELEEWEKNRQEELRKMGLLNNQQQKRSLPFKRFEVDGYDVWIGKNAKSNDELTSRAHKEDIWLHARGVPGSHTVIRMDNNRGYPQKKTLLRVASHAAWHSSARTSKLVPVTITKRKYVSKPKGSPAGSVRVRQESVEMVRPEPT